MSIALSVAQLTLFVAGPVLGVQYLIGWGAGLGGLVGAVVGAERSSVDVSTLVTDALANGQAVLEAHAHTEAETSPAQAVVSQHIDRLSPATVQARVPVPAAV